MAATAIGVLSLYLLLSQATNFATESSFRDSDILPDMISTAPSTQAKVRHDDCRPARNLERKSLPPVALYVCKNSITLLLLIKLYVQVCIDLDYLLYDISVWII